MGVMTAVEERLRKVESSLILRCVVEAEACALAAIHPLECRVAASERALAAAVSGPLEQVQAGSRTFSGDAAVGGSPSPRSAMEVVARVKMASSFPGNGP